MRERIIKGAGNSGALRSTESALLLLLSPLVFQTTASNCRFLSFGSPFRRFPSLSHPCLHSILISVLNFLVTPELPTCAAFRSCKGREGSHMLFFGVSILLLLSPSIPFTSPFRSCTLFSRNTYCIFHFRFCRQSHSHFSACCSSFHIAFFDFQCSLIVPAHICQ